MTLESIDDDRWITEQEGREGIWMNGRNSDIRKRDSLGLSATLDKGQKDMRHMYTMNDVYHILGV